MLKDNVLIPAIVTMVIISIMSLSIQSRTLIGIFEKAQSISTSTTQNNEWNIKSRRPHNDRITVAACHKSIFGSVTLDSVMQWAAYHYLLGVDKVYIWYLSEMRNVTDPRTGRNFIDTLAELPYVELVENTIGKTRLYVNDPNNKAGYVRVARGSAGDQVDDEKQCLNMTKHLNYTWVLMADVDEYLWLNRSSTNIRSSENDDNNEPVDLKTLLEKYDNYTYLSFGKWMYSMQYKYGDNSSNTITTQQPRAQSFFFEDFPYTAKSFCALPGRKQLQGQEMCPNWRGRSKLIVRPQHHDVVNIHGSLKSLPTPTAIHFSTSDAHFKEWPAVFKEAAKNNTYTMDDKFRVEKEAMGADLHNSMYAYQYISSTRLRMYRDQQLSDWFDHLRSFIA